MIEVKRLNMPEINAEVTLTIDEGITYLSGKNGSGKTMLLDYLCNIRQSDTGAIAGNEQMIYLRQNFTFHNRLKVQEFIDFVYRLCGEDVSGFSAFLQRYSISFDMDKLNATRLGMLSGGERRALYVWVILSLPRTWYVLDEPFVNIDKATKKAIIDVIVQLTKEHKHFIITNHEEFPYLDEHVDHRIDVEQTKTDLVR